MSSSRTRQQQQLFLMCIPVHIESALIRFNMNIIYGRQYRYLYNIILYIYIFYNIRCVIYTSHPLPRSLFTHRNWLVSTSHLYIILVQVRVIYYGHVLAATGVYRMPVFIIELNNIIIHASITSYTTRTQWNPIILYAYLCV